MKLGRLTYFSVALLIVLVSGGLGILFYTLDVGNYSYLFTIYPSQTKVDISTSNTVLSIAIFICGAVFSTGLSMIINLLQFDKKEK